MDSNTDAIRLQQPSPQPSPTDAGEGADPTSIFETIRLRISTNRDELDVELIHRFLSEESYWKKGVSIEVVRKSIAHSLCFGGYLGNRQIAFGRVITDYADFGYLRDVFVVKEYRGKGYGKQIVQEILSHPELRGVNFLLGTEDAHRLYEQFGFAALPNPERLMRRLAR